MSRKTAQTRVKASRWVERVLLGRAGNVLREERMVRSIPERMNRSAVHQHIETINLVDGATVERYDFPDHFPPTFRSAKGFDDKNVYTVRDVVISPHTGLVWIPARRPLVLLESYGSLYRSMGWGDIRPDLLQGEHQDSGCGSVIPFPSVGFFHWLLEVVPATLNALRVSPDARLLMPPVARSYAEEMAARLVGPDRIVRSDRPLRVDRVTFTAAEPLSGFVRRSDIDCLRAAFPVDATEVAGKGIYVSRLKDARRALANEREVEDAARHAGLAVVYAQDMSLAEQRAVFAQAPVVVGPHGAGLANLVWARRAQRLIEIFPPGIANDCYARLCRSLGIAYDYIKASEDRVVHVHDFVDVVERDHHVSSAQISANLTRPTSAEPRS